MAIYLSGSFAEDAVRKASRPSASSGHDGFARTGRKRHSGRQLPPPSGEMPPRRTRSMMSDFTDLSFSTSEGGDSGDDDEGAGEKDDGDDEADKPEVQAPSGVPPKRRGHQTGLSLSLAGTSLAPARKSLKRSRSSDSAHHDDARRLRGRRPATDSSVAGPPTQSLRDDEDDDADNHGYTDLEFISGSELSDSGVEAAEEAHIVESEEERLHDGPVEPMPSPEGEFFDEHFGRTAHAWAEESSCEDFSTQESITPTPLTPSSRQVRFATPETQPTMPEGIADESIDAAEPIPPLHDPRSLTEATGAPDVQSRPRLEEAIAASREGGNLQAFKAPIPNEQQVEGGYESDGETTDDEVVTPITVSRPSSRLHFADHDSPPSRPSTKQRLASSAARRMAPPPAKRRRGPTMGSWIPDPTKPVAIVDGTGKHFVVYPAQQPSGASTCNTTPNRSRSTSFASVPNALDEANEDRYEDPLNSAVLANAEPLGALAGDGNIEEIWGSNPIGPPQAFSPFTNINATGELDEIQGETSLQLGDICRDSVLSEEDVAEDGSSKDVLQKNAAPGEPRVYRRYLQNQPRQSRHIDQSAGSNYYRDPQRYKLSSKFHYPRILKKTAKIPALKKLIPSLGGSPADRTLGKGIPALSRAALMKRARIISQEAAATRAGRYFVHSHRA